MKVRDAVDLLVYGQAFYIKGTHNGKIYHKSYENKREHLEKYLDEEVPSDPFFADLYTSKHKYGQAYTYPIIGIWMCDYYICRSEKEGE